MTDRPGPWVDAHCHLPTDDEARSELLREAAAAGVTTVVTVGCDVASSEACRAVAHHGDDHGVAVWATAGVHPHDARTVVDAGSGLVDLTAIEALLTDDRVVGVGECGLDYHYDHSPRDQQRAVFAAQVALANERARPLVIHTREAWDDTFAVLADVGLPERAVLHCFTGGPAEAERALAMGLWLSFSGIVTFKTADELRAAATRCPPDRLLVETDAPYLAPVPHRGRPNRPALVTVVGEAVAAARGVTPAEVADQTRTNALRFFGIG